jgi:hypothetical protein
MVSATSGGTFNSGVTIKTSDNSNTLRLTSTDADADVGPSLNLYRNSGSPADGDSIGDIEFDGRNDASEDVRYARIRGRIDDASDGTEDSKLIFEVIAAGSQQEAVRFEPSGVVFNESSNDVDFRVESNGKANMFFVDGGNDSVIIGHNAKISAVGSLDANLQLVSGDAQPSLDIVCFSDNANHRGQVTFSKSASDTIGTGAVVGTSDLVGDIVWGVHDGTDFANEIAFIRGAMDSTGVGANDTGGMLQFGTSSDGNNSASERMRIAEDGDVFIGVTALPSSSTGGAGFQVANNNRNVLYLATSVSSNTSLAVFINSNGQVGGIKTSGSATAFNTSSDYRLKENVNYSWDATTRLKQLKPARFNFKADADVTVDGFLAHEVSSIVPEAISGEKDETQNVGTVKNKDGKILYENVEEYKADIDKEQTWTKTGTEDVYQQIDQSKLVPLLVKTIQELEARVTALESA